MSSFNTIMQISRGRIAKRSGMDCFGILMVLVAVTGCARPDWIESMLVTVDVTGTWTGDWEQSRGCVGGGVGAGSRGRAVLSLQQVGPNVTGSMTVSGSTWLAGNLRSLPDNSPVEGTVNGDVLRLSASGVEIE